MRQRRFGVSVVLRGTDAKRLDSALTDLKKLLVDLGGEPEDESPDDPQSEG